MAEDVATQRSAPLWSVLGLALGLAASAAASLWYRDSLVAEVARAHDALVARTQAALAFQLESGAMLLRSVQTLYLASDEVTPDEFEIVYENLGPRRVFPSLVAFVYAERRVVEDTERYISVMASPSAGNEAVVGLDIATQPVNLVALQRARDSNEVVMSAAFRLVQVAEEEGLADGVVMRLPVFTPGRVPLSLAERRDRHIGSLAASFRVRALIDGVVGGDVRERFAVSVLDVTDAEPRLLYAHGEEGQATGPVRSVRLQHGGRTWEMRLTALQPEQAQVGSAPWLTFLGGAIASLLFAALVWSLVGTRARALRLAHNYSVQFRESEARFRALNELLPALVLLIRGRELQIAYANQAARRSLGLGFESEESMAALTDDTGFRERLAEILAGGGAIENQPVQLRKRGGQGFWSTVSVSRVELGGRFHLLAVANDISELRELNERLRYQASHDVLTDLLNRREFEHHLEAEIRRVDDGGRPAALLYVDLDQFKLINDTCGHYAGDELLSQLAAVLRRGLRPEDVLARLGGDEFGVLLTNVSAEEALAAAERMRAGVDGFVFSWEGRDFSLTTSIGIVMLDRAGMSRRELMALADTACYMAKERGRNRAHLFSANDLETARRRNEMEWASRLRRALAEDRFELDYQEIAPLKPSGQDAGAHIELLLRLRDEQGRRVSPGDFIPAAERYGLMPLVDRWVVETALANFDSLHPSGAALAQCAINLSALSVEDEAFATDVLSSISRHGVPAHKICFEITETAAVGNMARVVRFMQRLRSIGCRFALDDFGAGMASFGYLKELPVDLLKIDGSFIRKFETDPVSYSIVRAVTDIGHQVGLQVVAEWVASERARELLRGLGVDHVQGFAIHVPEPTPLFAKAGAAGTVPAPQD